jgi:hypothetical protein
MNETENSEMDVQDNQNHSNLNYTTGYQHHKNMKKQLVGPALPCSLLPIKITTATRKGECNYSFLSNASNT